MLTIRISFEKRAEAAYISLLDLQRVFQRILKRSGLPVYYTQGFNPHIYLSFASPLSLGQESLCESCEVKTAEENPDLSAWKETLQPFMPRGILIRSVAPVQEKSSEIGFADYTITLPLSAEDALLAYNESETAMVSKKTKRGTHEVDLKTYIPRLDYEKKGDSLSFSVRMPCASGEGVNLNPSLLLAHLQQTHAIPPWQCEVLRTQLYTKNGAVFC